MAAETAGRPALIAVFDQTGARLDAHFEAEDGAIIFHSRGGTRGTPNARNTQYGDGLRSILSRLDEAGLEITGVWVDSSRVQNLPLNERLVVSGEEALLGAEAIFRLASRRMQKVGSVTDAAAGGNSNKRLRIGLSDQVTAGQIIAIINRRPAPSLSIDDDLQPPATRAMAARAAASVEAGGGETNADSLPSGRVWATSFWGFTPENEGYLGFTRSGDREWFLRHLQPGDLVMVYATSGTQTEEGQRGNVLGFLEVENRRIRDVDRTSPTGMEWKTEAGVTDRWTYAVPISRAWRVTELHPARSIAPETLGPNAVHQLIASRGVQLTESEAAAALLIPVLPADVYGKAPLDAGEKQRIYVPSRGFPMSFGKRETEVTDGQHFLYALQLMGDVSAVLSEPLHTLRGKAIFKVGLAKEPKDRCAQHNATLPPAGRLKWKLILKSKAFADGQAALDAETAMKNSLSQGYRSLGGEFFLCDEKTFPANFASCANPSRS